ncbi:MAG: hypothetical protein Q8L48_19850 [Archangium sp.]|nr:hypothetical protein [Archangium sp.]
MGGSWISVRLKRLGDESSPRELHQAVWDRLSDEIHRALRRRENQQVLADYLGSTAYDGFADDDWASTETELTGRVPRLSVRRVCRGGCDTSLPKS